MSSSGKRFASQVANFSKNALPKKLSSTSQFRLGDVEYPALFAVNEEIATRIGIWNAGNAEGRSSHIGKLWNDSQVRLDIFVGENGVLRYPFADTKYSEVRTYNTDVAEYSGNSADITNVDTTTTMLRIDTTLPFASNNPIFFYWLNTWIRLLNPSVRGFLKSTEPFDIYLYMNDIRKQVEITTMSFNLDATKGYVDITFNVVVMKHEEISTATSGFNTILASEADSLGVSAINAEAENGTASTQPPGVDQLSARNDTKPVIGGFEEMNA